MGVPQERQLQGTGNSTTTTTQIPGTCSVPEIPLKFNASACVGLFYGESCSVTCASGYTGGAVTYQCGSEEDYVVGSLPVCTKVDAGIKSSTEDNDLDESDGVVHMAGTSIFGLILVAANLIFV